MQPALLIGLIIQTVGFGIYIGKVDTRLSQVEERVVRREVREDKIDQDGKDITNRVVRIEERTSATLEILRRLERWVDAQRRSDIRSPGPPRDDP